MTIIKFLASVFLIVSVILGNIYKYSFLSPQVRVSPLDVAVALIFFLAAAGNWVKWKKLLQDLFAHHSQVFLFILVCLISLSFSIFRYGFEAFLVGLMYLLRFTSYVFLYVSVKTIFTNLDIRRLIITLSLLHLLSGLLQYIFLPDVRFLQVSEWDPHFYRVVGTLLDPGFFGIISVFILVHFYLHPLSDNRLNWIYLFLNYLVLAFTYSRSTFLAFLMGALILSVIKKTGKLFVYCLLLVLATLVLLPRSPDGEGVKLERTSSIRARITNWKNSIAILLDNPVQGVGFNTYRYAQKEYGYIDDSKWLKSHAGAGADSSLLFVAATTGILGLLAYTGMMSGLYLFTGLRPYIGVVLVHSIFLNSQFYPFVLLWLVLLAVSNSYKRESFPS